MQIALENIVFENDFYDIGLEDGNVLRLNLINESLAFNNETAIIHRINIEKIVYMEDDKEEHTICTSIIGLSDKNIKLSSDYVEYVGEPLDSNNMRYCTIEV